MLYGLKNVALKAGEISEKYRGGQYAAGLLYGLAASSLGLKNIIHVSNGMITLLHRKPYTCAALDKIQVFGTS